LGVGVLNNPQIVMLRGRAFSGTGWSPGSNRPIAWPYRPPESFICTTTSACRCAGPRRRTCCGRGLVTPVLPAAVPTMARRRPDHVVR